MTRSLRLGLIATSLLSLAAVRTVAQPVGDGLDGPSRTSFNEGLELASQGKWGLAAYSFGVADSFNPNLPRVWFNLGLAESNIPGHELRAAALLKAFLLRMPQSPQRNAIDRLRLTLEATVRERIRTILSGALAPSESSIRQWSCDSDRTLARIENAQLRAGLYNDARATLLIKKPHCAGDNSSDSDQDPGMIAAASEIAARNVSASELHEIGRHGFTFSGVGYNNPVMGAACWLKVAGQDRNRNGSDLELGTCLTALKTNQYGNRAADYRIFDGMLGLANTLSDVLALVQ